MRSHNRDLLRNEISKAGLGVAIVSDAASAQAKRVDFSAAISAALKKKVPVTTVMEPDKAQWIIKAVSSQKEDTTGTKVAKLIFAGASASFTQFEGAIQVIDRDSSEVLFAYN